MSGNHLPTTKQLRLEDHAFHLRYSLGSLSNVGDHGVELRCWSFPVTEHIATSTVTNHSPGCNLTQRHTVSPHCPRLPGWGSACTGPQPIRTRISRPTISGTSALARRPLECSHTLQRLNLRHLYPCNSTCLHVLGHFCASLFCSSVVSL